MKSKTLINIVVAILFLSVSQLHAQSFFSVYCNNGYNLKLNLASIDSIVHSKIDINGNERMTYQTKEIWTSDSVYRIALEDIDSVAIIPVEEVAHYIANVTTGMDSLFKNSKTIDELSSHINEIEAIDGVEGVWHDDITLFVDVRGWGVISYMFPPTPEDCDTVMTARADVLKANTHNQANLKKVGIVDLVSGDPAFDRAKNNANLLYKNFINCGFSNTKVISHAGLNFFEKDMFDYDVLFLITHGGYTLIPDHYEEKDGEKTLKYKGRHFIVTSDLVDISPEGNPFAKALAFLKSDEKVKNADTQKINIALIKISGDESNYYCYVEISDLYIKSLSRKFKDNSIVFMTACQAFKNNFNLANAFIGKGAGAVLGYSDTNNMGDAAGYYFFNSMLNGMTVSRAYEAIPDGLKRKRYTKNGKEYYPQLYVEGEGKNTCMIYPQTEDYEDMSTTTSLKVELRGRMTKLNPTETGGIELGICVSKTKGDKSNKIKAELKPQNFSVDFGVLLDDDYLVPQTQYYYCAYLYDGNGYCYGEEKSFKTKNLENKFCPDHNHPHAIDLGLPSGTKWACCNVGANNPEGFGGYYAWGETKEKAQYSYDNYLFESIYTMPEEIKRTSMDAAFVNMKKNGNWCMPNVDEMKELLRYCKLEEMELNGVKGSKFIGQNGNCIFIPATGWKGEKDTYDKNLGYYWSSTRYTWDNPFCMIIVNDMGKCIKNYCCPIKNRN